MVDYKACAPVAGLLTLNATQRDRSELIAGR